MTEAATRMTPDSARPYITQSSFYSPAFNGAVFDGPLRLYFSQSQEAVALKFYFELRARSVDSAWPRSEGPNVFVMIYPNEETFDLCFTSQGRWSDQIGTEVDRLPTGRLGRDLVVALQASDLDGAMDAKVDQVVKVVSSFAHTLSLSGVSSPTGAEA